VFYKVSWIEAQFLKVRGFQNLQEAMNFQSRMKDKGYVPILKRSKNKAPADFYWTPERYRQITMEDLLLITEEIRE
jgi:hypothetical protein